MELSHSLTLNEEAFKQIPDHKKPVFVFEWLRFLDKVLGAAHKVCRRNVFNVSNRLDIDMYLIFYVCVLADGHQE